MAKKKTKAKRKPAIEKIALFGYWMAPLSRRASGYKPYMPDIVYGENVECAFRAARREWPSADGWHLYGGVKSSDRECWVEIPESGTRVTLRISKVKVRAK